MRKAKTYLLSGLMLSFITLILRLISVFFNMYIHRQVGGEKLGLYSLILSVYALAVTFASSGIYLTCTKMVADALALKKGKEARRSLFGCMLYSMIFGILGSLLLYFLSKTLGNHVLREPEAVTAFRFLSLSLPAVSLSSCLSGYFTAARRVYKSGILSLLEQIFKIVFTVLLFRWLLPKGRGVTALIAASVLGEILTSFLYLLVLFPDMKKHIVPDGSKDEKLCSRILNIALPIAFTAWMRSALLSLEHILIPRGLKLYGDAHALSTYGVLHALAFPVIFFPSAILSAFCNLFMPEISRFHVRKEQKEISFTASRMLRLTLLFSVGCSGILLFFGKDLGMLLYSSKEAGKMISLFSLLIPVMYIDTAADAVLKGLGEQVYCMKINIADAFLSLLFVYFLVPEYGLTGYVITVFLSETFNTFMSLKKLASLVSLKIHPVKSLLLPLLSVCLSASLLRLLPTFSFLINMTLSSLFYLLLLFLTNSFMKSDRLYFQRLFSFSKIRR